MRRDRALRTIGEQAADQWGLVTASQAKVAGLSAVDLLRLVEAGLLESVGRGVYLVTGAARPDHLEIKVAWLRLEPELPAWRRHTFDTYGGVVSHGSACVLQQLGELPASTVEISVPRRRTTRERGVRLRRADLAPDDVVRVDGLPVTTAERTVVDLLAAHVDGAHVGGVIADADRRGLTNRASLAERVARFAGAYGLPRSAAGERLLEYLAGQAGTKLPVEESTRLRREGAVQGFVSALALLLSGLEDAQPKDAAIRRSINQDLIGFTGISSLAEQLAKVGPLTSARSEVIETIKKSFADHPNSIPSLPPSVLTAIQKILAESTEVSFAEHIARSIGQASTISHQASELPADRAPVTKTQKPTTGRGSPSQPSTTPSSATKDSSEAP
ncbi:type IV toxin-antitoxin system AbiEi family antitoxin domain-containing protein [Sphaerisporangium sp. NPDC049003]|uniref:type IV toxin-antitoxin system AbiEi family antitoxin domain-containing protein n=1 Tax=Sphaerisporangium sp. NPDC049003 TaxID=3364517 RepID=UPI00371DB268